MNFINKNFFKNKKLFILTIILLILTAVGTTLVSAAVGFLVDSGTTDQFNEFVLNFLYVVLFLLLLIIIIFFALYFESLFLEKTHNDLRASLFKSYYNKSPESFSSMPNGYYVSKIINDTVQINNNYYGQIIELIHEGLICLFAVIYAFYISWIIALVMIGLSLILLIVTLFFRKPTNNALNKISKANEDFTVNLNTALDSHEVSYLFSQSKYFNDFFEQSNMKRKTEYFKFGKLKAFYFSTSNFFVFALQIISLFVSVLLYTRGHISIGAITSLLVLSSNILNPISSASSHVVLILGSKEIISELNHDLSFVKNKTNHKRSSFSKLIFNNASYYDEIKDKNVLLPFQFEILKGDKVLLLGNSGSGKSTFIKLACGLLSSNDSKSILYESESGELFTPSEYISNVSASLQKPFVFCDTLQKNIIFNESKNENKFEFCVSQSLLTPIIDAHPLNIKIDINKLSGGEIRRIDLARSFYKDCDILYLDEPSSSLDKEAEFLLYENILKMEEKTIVCSAHKLNSNFANQFSKVIVFEKGQIYYYQSTISDISKYLS